MIKIHEVIDVEGTDDEFIELRELCMDLFAAAGLKENDEPNATGLLIEDLVDKFHTG